MKKLAYLVLLLLHTTICHSQKQFSKRSIYFESDRWELSAESKKTLDQLYDSIVSYKTFHIFIRGNTDNTGDSLYNIKLSQQRVQACRNYFVDKGISDSAFTISFLGENKPKASNETEEGKHENRRVDISIQYARPVPKPLPSIRELYRKLERKKQEFCIRNDRDTTIYGEQGTMIRINANTFQVPKGCGSSCITFVLREDYLKSDMMIDNLTTLWDRKILESQAMVFTDAMDCQGNRLAMTKDGSLGMITPTQQLESGAALFNGGFTGHDSTMNWNPTTDIGDVLPGFNTSSLESCKDYTLPPRTAADCDCDFSCRLKRFDNAVAGWFSKCKRRDNKVFRLEMELCKLNNRYLEIDTARKLSKARKKTMLRKIDMDIAAKNREISGVNQRFPQCPVPRVAPNDPDTCEDIAKLLKAYGVTNVNALYDTLNKLQLKRRAKLLETGAATVEDMQYYVFSVSKLGWTNCDLLARFPQTQRCAITVGLKPEVDIDCKLVFKNKRSAIPFDKERDTFRLKNIPKDEPAWIIALKYKDGKAYMFIQEIIAGIMTVIPVFVEYTIEELREKLKMLDK